MSSCHECHVSQFDTVGKSAALPASARSSGRRRTAASASPLTVAAAPPKDRRPARLFWLSGSVATGCGPSSTLPRVLLGWRRAGPLLHKHDFCSLGVLPLLLRAPGSRLCCWLPARAGAFVESRRWAFGCRIDQMPWVKSAHSLTFESRGAQAYRVTLASGVCSVFYG